MNHISNYDLRNWASLADLESPRDFPRTPILICSTLLSFFALHVSTWNTPACTPSFYWHFSVSCCFYFAHRDYSGIEHSCPDASRPWCRSNTHKTFHVLRFGVSSPHLSLSIYGENQSSDSRMWLCFPTFRTCGGAFWPSEMKNKKIRKNYQW
jgi:hypothetical protein